MVLGAEILEFFRIEDPVGAWPVHGLNGIWGTLSLGLFATGQYSAVGSSPTGVPTPGWKSADALTGLFYGGGAKVLLAQCIGSAIIVAATFIIAMTMFGVINAIGHLRISKEGEVEGIDLHEHGISAYPEYVLSPSTALACMPAEMINTYPSTARPATGMPIGSVALGE